MTPTQGLLLFAAGVGGGMMNAIAGGGTILVFPALLFLGQPAVGANATCTVALLPGAAASLFGFRREVQTHRDWLKTLLLPSLLGGAIGSILLLRTPEKLFAHLAPVLILFATTLFLLQGYLAGRRKARESAGTSSALRSPVSPAVSPVRWLTASLFQLGVAIYGGYFGAGIGILMLAVLGFLGLQDIHAMNGLKNFFNLCINAVAAVYFIFRGAVVWPAALAIVGGAIVGGYGGARFAHSIGPTKARTAVVVIGVLIAVLLFWQQARG